MFKESVTSDMAGKKETEKKTLNIFSEKFKSLNNEDAEEKFYELIDDLSTKNIELAENWKKRLEKEVDNESISIQEACSKLNDVLLKRISIENEAYTTEMTANERQGYEVTESDIRLSESLPPNFLGNGAVAEVYKLARSKNLCVKIVKDFDKYNEGNTIHQEARFLSNLNNFEVDGVRTPQLYYVLSNINTTAIIMEELDAVNFRRVLEGHDKLPENFNIDDYFSRLKNYLQEIHKKGVYHQDFVLRNFMIDRKTGRPYVIDFGKAEFKDDLMGEKFHIFENLKKDKDYAGLEASIKEVKEKTTDNKVKIND